MNYIKIILFVSLILLAVNSTEAKRNFTFNDAMKFESIRSPRTSNDGNWFAFEAKQDRGDTRACIYSANDTTKFSIPNGKGITFSNDSRWAAITINPTNMEAENKDKKNNKLKLINLQTKEETDEDNLTNFTFSEDSKWLAYKIKLDNPAKPDKMKDKSVGSPLKLKHLASGTDITIDNVTTYLFDTLSTYLFYIVSAPDGKKDGIYCRELKKEFAPERKIITDTNKYYGNLAWNKERMLLAFFSSTPSDKGKPQDCSLLIADLINKTIDTIIIANKKAKKDDKADSEKLPAVKDKKKSKKDENGLPRIINDARSDEGNTSARHCEQYEVLRGNPETTPSVADAKSTPPQEGNSVSGLKFPSRGGVPASAGGVVNIDCHADKSARNDNANHTRHTEFSSASPTDKETPKQVRGDKEGATTPLDKRTIDTNWYLPSENKLTWNDSCTLLYFGMKPASERYEENEEIKFKDSSYYNFDTLMKKSEVYVWGWNDPHIMSVQQKQWNKEKDRVYYAVYSPDTKKYVRIADTNVYDVSISKNDNYTLAYTDKPYRIEQTWYGTYYDLYVVDLKSGNKIKVCERLEERAYMSVSGNYVLYYKDLHWHLYNTKNNISRPITDNVPTEFYNLEQDIPTTLYSCGFGGWIDDDKGFFLYDNYDIWRFEIKNSNTDSGQLPAVNFTKSNGKKNNVKYTLRKVDMDKDYYQSTDTLIITAFNKITKDAGIYTALLTDFSIVERIPMSAQFFRDIRKPKDNNKIFFAKEKYHEFPNYYLTDFTFKQPKRITDLNLNILDTFNWGRTELVKYPYKTPSGRDTTLLGYLVLPDNYDSKKKYPVFVYFYDQMSDRMNRFYQPELTHRPVNQIFMDNYIMFFPDIDYGYEKASANIEVSKIGSGRPGQDAFDCIMAGCRYLASKGIIDTNKSCVQGHSWGGYQTAYIATIPSFFKAACAGAPVGNMTSAYSGIRTESGRVRQFQYEAQQSRIGGSIFDSLQAYISNSPIFFANNSTTPLLIGHGDVDEAVPYQQGVELYMAFRRAQKPSWLLQYVNEPHWQGRYWNKLDYSVKMKEFFDHYVLGTPAPAWMTKGQPYKGENWGR